MASNPTHQRVPSTSSSIEPKARGANRSTKVAGKLKVLPDQPEPIVPVDKIEPPPPPKSGEGAGSATAEDSDDDEGDDEAEAEDTEEADVSNVLVLMVYTSCAYMRLPCRSTTKLNASLLERRGETHYG